MSPAEHSLIRVSSLLVCARFEICSACQRLHFNSLLLWGFARRWVGCQTPWKCRPYPFIRRSVPDFMSLFGPLSGSTSGFFRSDCHPVSILYKSTARYRFIKNASWAVSKLIDTSSHLCFIAMFLFDLFSVLFHWPSYGASTRAKQSFCIFG